MSKNAENQAAGAPRGAIRWGSLRIIAVVALLLFLFVRQQFADDTAMRHVATAALLLLTTIALWLWWGLGAGLGEANRARVLLGVPAVLALLVTGFLANFRFIGFTGDMRPQFAFRWSAGPASSASNTSVGKAARELQGAYPQFLGPDRMPVVRDVKLARTWNERPPRLVWKQPIGEGWSAFAVMGNRAVTQEQDGDNELITCYDLLSGRRIWTHTDTGRFSEFMGGDGPRATPTIFAGRVYTLGGFGQLDCLDLATGKPVWPGRNVLKDASADNLQWGMAGSPLVVGGQVIVNPGGTNGSSLMCYDGGNGSPVWRGGSAVSCYCSPVFATLCGVDQIVIVNQTEVTGHNAQTGAVLWSFPWEGGQPKVSQPVPVGNDRVFCSAGYGLGCMLLQIAEDKDGTLKATNLYGRRNPNMKTKFANVALDGDVVYGLDDGTFECLAWETGQRLWKGGRYGHGQIILVGDVILVQAENGEVAMVEAIKNDFNELARFQALEGKTWNNPALAGPYLLVRNDHEAACYELELAIEKKDQDSGFD